MFPTPPLPLASDTVLPTGAEQPSWRHQLGLLLESTGGVQKWLKVVSYKGSLSTPVPTDPLIYRWYEVVSVYGSTIKE